MSFKSNNTSNSNNRSLINRVHVCQSHISYNVQVCYATLTFLYDNVNSVYIGWELQVFAYNVDLETPCYTDVVNFTTKGHYVCHLMLIYWLHVLHSWKNNIALFPRFPLAKQRFTFLRPPPDNLDSILNVTKVSILCKVHYMNGLSSDVSVIIYQWEIWLPHPN